MHTVEKSLSLFSDHGLLGKLTVELPEVLGYINGVFQNERLKFGQGRGWKGGLERGFEGVGRGWGGGNERAWLSLFRSPRLKDPSLTYSTLQEVRGE